MEALSLSISRALDARGWSMSELARRTDISVSSISRYIGGNDMPITSAVKIADAFGVGLDELLGRDFDLTGTERELLLNFRSMSPRFRSDLLSLARSMADGGAAKNNDVPEAV